MWLRPISPIENGFHSFAIAFVNRNEKIEADCEMNLETLGLVNPNGYYLSVSLRGALRARHAILGKCVLTDFSIIIVGLVFNFKLVF